MRELKALELAARQKIVWTGESWSVPSQNRNKAGNYKVQTWPGAESCTCDDFALRQEPCKHILAARLTEEREGKRSARQSTRLPFRNAPTIRETGSHTTKHRPPKSTGYKCYSPTLRRRSAATLHRRPVFSAHR